MFAASRRLVCLVVLWPCLGTLLSPAAALAQQPATPPANPTDPHPIWSMGRGFRLHLVLSRPAVKEKHIEMHVVVTGEQKLDDRECWSLEFIPVHAPPGFGSGGYRVLLEKASGVLRQIAPRPDRVKTLPPPVAGLPFPHEPPEGYPWEVLPFVTAPPPKPGTDGLRLELTRRPEKGHTWYEATIRENGTTVLVVKHKWADGGLWWSEYERWYEGHRELSGTLVPAGQPIKAVENSNPPQFTSWAQIESQLHGKVDAEMERHLRSLARHGSLGQQTAAVEYFRYMEQKRKTGSPKEGKHASTTAPPPTIPQGTKAVKGSGLQSDARLQALVTLNLQAPSIEDILSRLRGTPGATLTVEEDTVAADRAAFASLTLKDAPAWFAMLRLADSQAVRGRWEPDEDRYRLVGGLDPTSPEPPAPEQGIQPWWTAAALGLVALVCGGFLVHHFRRRAAARRA